MKLIKRERSINHDYYQVVTSVYPKIIDRIESIFYLSKKIEMQVGILLITSKKGIERFTQFSVHILPAIA